MFRRTLPLLPLLLVFIAAVQSYGAAGQATSARPGVEGAFVWVVKCGPKSVGAVACSLACSLWLRQRDE